MSDFLEIARGDAPLLVSIPHTGTGILESIGGHLASDFLARKDTDWWVERLYDFAVELGATVVRTRVSRAVIDVNRDPSGASLYPGQATTELCPTTTFDGEPLYRPGYEPDEGEIDRRRRAYFDPYHEAVQLEIARLQSLHRRIVLYDCHSIRSVVPRLFSGELPHLNVGTNSGASCAGGLQESIEALCAASNFSWVSNGRFKGGWITRRHGRPDQGVHAVQMELACRTYLREPVGPVDATNWPVEYDAAFAAPARALLRSVLQCCIAFAAAPLARSGEQT